MSLGQKIVISWIWDNHTGYIMHPFEIYVSLCRSVQSRVPSYIGTEQLILLPLYLAQIQYVYLPLNGLFILQFARPLGPLLASHRPS